MQNPENPPGIPALMNPVFTGLCAEQTVDQGGTREGKNGWRQQLGLREVAQLPPDKRLPHYSTRYLPIYLDVYLAVSPDTCLAICLAICIANCIAS